MGATSSFARSEAILENETKSMVIFVFFTGYECRKQIIAGSDNSSRNAWVV